MAESTLFEQVKRKLNVTWDDPDTNSRIQEIIDSGIPEMIHILGIPDENYDFSTPGMENALFKNYCLYEWNHCLQDFEKNYANNIAHVQAKYDVKHYQKTAEETGNEENI